MTKQNTKNNLEKKLRVQTLFVDGGEESMRKSDQRFYKTAKIVRKIKRTYDVAPLSGQMESGFDAYMANFVCFNCANNQGEKTKILNFAEKEKKPLIITYLFDCKFNSTFGNYKGGGCKPVDYVEIYDGKRKKMKTVEYDQLFDEDVTERLIKYIIKLKGVKTQK